MASTSEKIIDEVALEEYHNKVRTLITDAVKNGSIVTITESKNIWDLDDRIYSFLGFRIYYNSTNFLSNDHSPQILIKKGNYFYVLRGEYTRIPTGDVYKSFDIGYGYANSTSGWYQETDLFDLELPVATSTTLGGVKVGAGLSINNGVLSATGGGTADSVDWSNVQNRPTKLSDFTNDSGFTTNTGTITGIKMNGASKGTSGVVDLGTVITAHQDISGKQDKITSTNKLSYSLISGTPTIPDVSNYVTKTGIEDLTNKTYNGRKWEVISTGTDFNTITDSGIYGIRFDPSGYHGPCGSWGTLIVSSTATTGTAYQIYIPDGATQGVYKRTIGGDWVNIINTLAIKGVNTIGSPEDDTPTDWSAQGNSIHWYDIADKLNGQPHQWGFLINYAKDGDVFQIWNSQHTGPAYFRSGNASGWGGNWKRIALYSEIPTKTSELTNDSGFLTQHQDISGKQDKISDTGWVNIPLASGISVGTLGGTPQYRKVGNHVFIRGGYKGTKSSATLQLGTLPEGYRPISQVYDFNATAGNRVARTYVQPGGGIMLEWIWTLQTNPAVYTGAFDWIDVEMDFWVD